MAEQDTAPQHQHSDDEVSPNEAAQKASERDDSPREGQATVDEKGNLIPTPREESGMGGPADENWRAGQTAEQPGPFAPKE